MKEVFISYSTRDTVQAEAVRNLIEQNGFSCWMAPRDIPGGSNYTKEIPVAIRGCKAFVLIFSAHSNASHWVLKEVDTAVNAGKVLLPFMLEDFPISDEFNFLLTGVQRYMAFEKKAEAMQALLDRIRQIVSGYTPPGDRVQSPTGSSEQPRGFDELERMSPQQLNMEIAKCRKLLEWNPADQALNAAIAFCYLRLGLYEKAIPCFEKAVEDNFENSEAFYYLAVALLRGKQPFLASKVAINRIEQYIQAALMIEPKGLYQYFWAYIRYDHHFRKMYRMNPDYRELLARAKQAGLTQTQITQMYTLLGTQRPNVL